MASITIHPSVVSHQSPQKSLAAAEISYKNRASPHNSEKMNFISKNSL